MKKRINIGSYINFYQNKTKEYDMKKRIKLLLGLAVFVVIQAFNFAAAQE